MDVLYKTIKLLINAKEQLAQTTVLTDSEKSTLQGKITAIENELERHLQECRDCHIQSGDILLEIFSTLPIAKSQEPVYVDGICSVCSVELTESNQANENYRNQCFEESL